MKKFENLGITTIVTGDKIKIEVKISGAVNAFNNSPNNFTPEATVKKEKRAEFAEYLAKALVDGSDPDTGDSPVMAMFENIFQEIYEGAEEFCNYPDEE
ncbi:hypothetical protein SAMN02744040_00087 [Tepidibacter thalassicus DSM 15285]|uniref:Uncharacterized protein n=2 Tax=Tepidibacter TaxID=214904 RepID=A0A1M5NK58_9FIRM|nr:hypothetical protein SAMN02744040_00087 [Tepidibacter thalassicus DSM 15285]